MWPFSSTPPPPPSSAPPLLPMSLHLDWLKLVFLGRTEPPSLTITRPYGLGLALFYIAACVLLGIFAAVTLPEKRHARTWTGLRLLLWTVVVKLSVDLSVDPRISLGAPIRDLVWPLLGWNFIARMTDICVVSIWDAEEEDKAPRWIVPEGGELARRYGGDKKDKKKTRSGGSDNASRWIILPHSNFPLLSLRRLLWALDHISLLRPGTSWLLPHEQRALEWSLPILTRPPPHSHHHRTFGRTEGLPYLLACVALSAAGLPLFSSVMNNLPSSLSGTGADHFYSLPWWKQGYVPLWIGINVPLQWTVMETLFLFPLARRLGGRLLPTTTLLPAFAQPLRSSGPIDLWGRRWHPFVRRTAWRNATLFVPRSWGATGSRLGAFVITGSLHSWAVVKWIRPLPPSTLHALTLMLLPGPMALFFGQGVACVVELALLGMPKDGEAGWKKWARWVWLWTSVAWMGRWFIASIVSLGLSVRADEGLLKWV